MRRLLFLTLLLVACRRDRPFTTLATYDAPKSGFRLIVDATGIVPPCPTSSAGHALALVDAGYAPDAAEIDEALGAIEGVSYGPKGTRRRASVIVHKEPQTRCYAALDPGRWRSCGANDVFLTSADTENQRWLGLCFVVVSMQASPLLEELRLLVACASRGSAAACEVRARAGDVTAFDREVARAAGAERWLVFHAAREVGGARDVARIVGERRAVGHAGKLVLRTHGGRDEHRACRRRIFEVAGPARVAC